MSVIRLIRHLSIAAVFPYVLLACIGPTNEQRSDTPPISKIPSATYEMREMAHDGDFVIPPGRLKKVDANSDLVLSFNVIKTDEVAETSPQWKRVNTLIEKVNELARERALLNEGDINLNDSQQLEARIKKLREKVIELDNKVLEIFSFMGKEMGLKSDEIRRILLGTFDGSKADPTNSYANLSRWLKREIERLRKEAADFVKNREQLGVTVQAFHDPIIGNRKALHIEGYDNLPAGELHLIDRTGLRLTPAEQQRLAMEIRQAEVVAAAIREVKENSSKIKAPFKELLAKLNAKVSSLEQQLKKAGNWADKLDASIKNLRGFANTTDSAEIKNTATELANQLEVLIKNADTINKAINQVAQLKADLENVGNVNLSTILLKKNGLLDTLNSFPADVNALVNLAKTELPKISDVLEKFIKQIKEVQAKQLIQPELREFFNSLNIEFPETAQAVELVAEFLKGSLKVSNGTDILSETYGEPIAHSLDDLTDATVELSRSGLTVGDMVTVKLQFKEKDKGEIKGRTIEETTYKAETTLMGVHRVISGDLIFSRGLSGDVNAKKWKPNVAASSNWHYTIRDPKIRCEKFWNWLDPGAGIHLASLDQGADSVEFGIGVNISLWTGLLKTGYGYNLSADEEPYVFLGIDLLNVLNRAKEVSR